MAGITYDKAKFAGLQRMVSQKRLRLRKIPSILDDTVRMIREFSVRVTPIGRPETPQGDRTRRFPYGSLSRGWVHKKIVKNSLVFRDMNQRAQATSIGLGRLFGSAKTAYSTGLSYTGELTHDAIQKKTLGYTVIKVLQKGAKPHIITAKNKKTLVYFSRRAQRLIWDRSQVDHPGYKVKGEGLINKIRAFSRRRVFHGMKRRMAALLGV